VDKGGFGGVGMLSVPLLMMVAPAQFVLGMWLPLLVLCDIFTLRAYPKEWKLRPVLLLAPGAMCGLGIGYLLPAFYFAWSLVKGPAAGPNPWGAKGLEWEIPSPPPTENFERPPVVTEPYNYAAGPEVHVG